MTIPIPIGTEYTATAHGSADKAVRCQRCGYAYGYTLRRSASGGAFSFLFLAEDAAKARAEARARAALEAMLHGIDTVPYPRCGDYQADMIPILRLQHRPTLYLAALAAIVLGGIWWPVAWIATGKSGHWAATVVGVLLAVGCLLARWVLARRLDPNAPEGLAERKSIGRFRATPVREPYRPGPPPQADGPHNTLDRHVHITVRGDQLRQGEAVDVPLPDGAGVASLRLRPDMVGRRVRLAGALRGGAGDLYVQILVVEVQTNTPGASNRPNG